MNTESSEIVLGIKRTLRLLGKSEKESLILATFLMIVGGVLTNLPAVILGRLVDKLIGSSKSDFTIVVPFIALIIATIIIREIITVIRKYLVENIATQTEKKQTVSVINHLLKTDIAVVNQQQIGSLHGRLFRSIEGLVRMIKLSFLDFFPVFFSAVAAIVIALIQKPLIATVMVLVIPTGIFIIIKQISSQKGIRVSLLRGKEKIDGTVVEMLGGIETIRVLNTAPYEMEKIESIAEELRKKEIHHHVIMALFDSGKYLNEGFFYILVISLAILMSGKGVISQGDILVYSILFLSITGPLREIHRILDQAHESSLLVNDLYDLLNQPTDISFSTRLIHAEKESIKESNPIVKIKNLSYTYPARSERVLDGINITIVKGEKIGLVGATGCGKTTLIKLLLRLLHKYSGDIYLLGKDLKTITREEIGEKVAYIPQQTYIFSGSIRENITYGCLTKKTEDDIIEAAKKARIYDEIVGVLGGLNGKVFESGKNLSGGQKQRLAIARLILKSPDIFIFDEATSALDNTNEAYIQKNIEQLFRDKTIITIAHRLTTLKNTDRILVFDKGRIVQEGTFNTLANQEGLFKEFLTQRDSDDK